MAREKGVSRWLYALVRGIVAPLFRLYFRMHIAGTEHIPAEGAAVIAPNHKSFWDSFFIAVCTRRHLRFMAKTELIEACWCVSAPSPSGAARPTWTRSRQPA
jgi:1-acyl-sn-glycerol-3-phosphate acyltransferase